MAEQEDRVNGAIEAIGFNKSIDPEFIEQLQATQRMYEQVADNLRDRTGIPFQKVLARVRAQTESLPAGETDAETEASPHPEPAE